MQLKSHKSPKSHNLSAMKQHNNHTGSFIPPHGGYRKPITFQKPKSFTTALFILPNVFNKYDRTVDQMVQAARSGKQNIAEASVASGTSKKQK